MLFLSSGDASDSICPKGWGMAGNDGDRSYQRLIIENYNSKAFGKTELSLKEYNRSVTIDSIMTNTILNYNYGGYYALENGQIGNRNTIGYYHSSIGFNFARVLCFYNTNLYMTNSYHKGYGYSLRCVANML